MPNNLTKADIQRLVIQYANKYGIDPSVMLALIEDESGFNPNARNNNNRESSVGLGQINLKAHPDYKGGTDPNANLDYATRLMANLLQRTGGDVEAAVAAYKGGFGGRNSNEARQLARRALARRNKYMAVANNAAQVPQNLATSTAAPNTTGVSSINPAALAAANTFGGTGITANQLQQMAETGRQRDQQLYNQLQQSNAQMLNYLNEPVTVVNPDGTTSQTSLRELYNARNAQVANQFNQAYDRTFEAIDPNSAANQQFNNQMIGTVTDAYNRYNQAVTAATPIGYTVDPDRIANLRRIDETAEAGVAMGLASPLSSATQRYLDDQRLAYEAQIAQANGIPFDRYIAMKNAQALAAQKEAADLASLANTMSTSRATSQGSLAKMLEQQQKFATDQMTLNQQDLQFQQSLANQVGEQNARALTQMMINNGTYEANKMNFLRGIETANINARANVLGAGINAGSRDYATNVGAQADIYTQGMANQNALEVQGLRNQGALQAEQLQQQDPSRTLNATSNLITSFAIADPSTAQGVIRSLPSSTQQALFPNMSIAMPTTNMPQLSNQQQTRPQVNINLGGTRGYTLGN